MKLHNLLLTAALFLTATVSFAAIETITTTKDGKTYTGYAWSVDKNTNNITVTLTRSNNSGNGTWSYELFAYKGGANSKDWSYTLNEENADSYKKVKNERIYTFHIPLTGPNNVDYDITSIGIISDKTSTSASISTENIFAQDSDFFYYLSKETGAKDNTISYGKITGKPGKEKEHMKAEFTFGQPLPAPVVTLLIALGFGAALVMYRNRKQAKA